MAATTLLALALVLALAVPGVHYWGLFLLFLGPFVERAWLRYSRR